ncbi:MAG: NF038143 family protein, partial [Desulfobacterales bacterium]|nr:NF038143 family protein [Desulfobacterales bacterium]
MPTPREKSLLVLQEERLFAAALAAQVIGKPQLSIWMILIPIIFVFFFFRFQKYVAGKKTFADNYLTSRQQALEEALAA